MELYERIRDLLNDSITDIFVKIQDEYKIECGDCPPDLEWDMNNAVDDLAEQMKTAFVLQMD